MTLQIRWFPPSWVQLRTGDSLLYIDPAYLQTYFTGYPGHIQFTGWPGVMDGLPEKLEAGDLILVTHHHKDHAKKVTIDRLTHPEHASDRPEELPQGAGHRFSCCAGRGRSGLQDGNIRVVQAYNMEPGKSTRKIHHKNQGVGYLVTTAGKTVYHAGDSDFIPEMLELAAWM